MLICKVVKINIINERKNFDGKTSRIADVLVGDAHGCVNFFAKEDSLNLIKEGQVYTFRNVHAAVRKEHMRLEVDKWAKLEAATKDDAKSVAAKVNESKNLSDEAYELVK